jgi:hypothetical protein
MIKSWLTWINWGIAGLALLFILLGIAINLWRPTEIPVTVLPPEKTTLPKGAFTFKKEDYDRIGPPLLNLKFSPMSLQLPDLRNYIVYYGRNERPDAGPEQSMLHFSFVGSKDIASIPVEKPLYLVYDKDQPRIKYRFSPNNSPTSLWIEASPGDKEITVNVAMKNEAGQIIRKPEQFSQFKLKEKEFSRFGADRWELGKWKVDGTLLARQRARWFGKDLFLEKHGGEEYKEYKDRQRIDFGQDEEVYSVYIGPGDALAWQDGRWKEIKPGPESQKFPLLVVQSVDERLMKLDLWDVDGKSKVILNLIKSNESSLSQNIPQTFKFVGARTRSQLMFEVNNDRMLLSPKDWLLYINNTWVKLQTPEEIDNYVNRKTVGPLFVIDDIVREDGRQALMGTLFNSTRTEMLSVEIPLQQTTPSSGSPGQPAKKDKKESNTKDFAPPPDGETEKRELIQSVEKDLDELKGYKNYIEKFRNKFGEMNIEEVKRSFPAAGWGGKKPNINKDTKSTR